MMYQEILRITYHYCFDDLAAGEKAFKYSAATIRRRCYTALLYLLAFVAFLVFRLTRRHSADTQPSVDWCLLSLSLLLLAFLTMSLFLQLFGRRMALRHFFDTTAELRQPHSLFVTEEGLAVSTPETQNFWDWRTFHRYSDTPDILLIYFDWNVYLPIPKRIFSPDQLNTFLQLCRQNIHEPAAKGISAYDYRRTSTKPWFFRRYM